MKRKRIVLLLGLAMILVLVVSACAPAAPAEPAAPAAEETASEEAAPAGEELTIALSVPAMQFPFFVFMEQAIKDEAEAIGGIEIVTLDGTNQVTKQTADVEAAIAKGYDGILISPMTADAMAPAVQQAVDAGIPVVTIDRTVYDVDTLAHVGADNVLGGEAQGEALMELFPDGAVIFELLGTPGSSPAIDRSAGLHNVIDGEDQVEVACQQTAEFARDKGLTITENCLGATPGVNAIIGANDEMAFGAVEAVKSQGVEDVVVMGYDALPEALIMVRDGELYGTVDQFPGEQLRTGLRTLVDFIREGTAPAEHDIFIQPKMITQDNLAEAERAAEIGAAPAAEAAAVACEEDITIALSVPAMQFPFFVFMEQEIKDEAEAIGGIEIVTLDGTNQVTKQTADVEAAIAKAYDGILISPMTADAMAPAVQQAVDAGIPVVTIDRTVYDVDTLAHVGADNVLGGEAQGEALLELFPDGAVIFELLGTPGSSPAIDRSAGLHNVIDGEDQVEVACQQTAEFARDKGLTITENCLGATPGVNAIIGANDEMAFGAVEAVKSQGVEDVVVMGYDALPEALIMVRDGELYGTVDQFPGEQSRVGLRTLVDFICGGVEPSEHDIFIQPKMITQDNLDEAERAAEIQ